jgi:hypothetical protein
MSRFSLWPMLVVVAVLGCGDCDRTTTAEAKDSLAGESFPFLFSARDFDAVRHAHSVQEGQAFFASGTMVFARKANARPQSAKALQTTLVRAARAARFKPMTPDREIEPEPPESELAWIQNVDTRISTLVWDEPVISNNEGGGVYECRLWIAPDASRFSAWYSIVY